MRFECIQCIFVVFLRDGECFAKHRLVVVPPVEHALIRGLRQTTGLHLQKIHLLWQAHAVHGHTQIVAGRAYSVLPDCALGLRHTGFAAHGLDVVLIKAHRAHQTVIIHILRIGIHVQCMYHCRLGQPEPAEKAHAQRHNGKNGEKAAK